MRIKLSDNNMDIVMYTVRERGLSIIDAVNYLLENPDKIESARGANVKRKEIPTKTFHE